MKNIYIVTGKIDQMTENMMLMRLFIIKKKNTLVYKSCKTTWTNSSKYYYIGHKNNEITVYLKHFKNFVYLLMYKINKQPWKKSMSFSSFQTNLTKTTYSTKRNLNKYIVIKIKNLFKHVPL